MHVYVQYGNIALAKLLADGESIFLKEIGRRLLLRHRGMAKLRRALAQSNIVSSQSWPSYAAKARYKIFDQLLLALRK